MTLKYPSQHLSDVLLLGSGRRSTTYLQPALSTLLPSLNLALHIVPSRHSPFTKARNYKHIIVSISQANRILILLRYLRKRLLICIDGPPLTVLELLLYLPISILFQTQFVHLEDQCFKSDHLNFLNLSSLPSSLINNGIEDLNHFTLRTAHLILSLYGPFFLLSFSLFSSLRLSTPKSFSLSHQSIVLHSTISKNPVPHLAPSFFPNSSFFSCIDSDGSKSFRVYTALATALKSPSFHQHLPTLLPSLAARILLLRIKLMLLIIRST